MRAVFLLGTTCVLAAMIGCRASSPYLAEARLKMETLIQKDSEGQILHSVTNLPSAIRDYIGPIADLSGRFAAGCEAPKGARRNRFLVATKTGQHYAVAVEHGGIARYWDITEFTVDRDGKVASVRSIRDTK